jgi:hypothetical protein
MTKDIKQEWQHRRVGSKEFYNQYLRQVIQGLVEKEPKYWRQLHLIVNK